jgi:hypothetical protein
MVVTSAATVVAAAPVVEETAGAALVVVARPSVVEVAPDPIDSLSLQLAINPEMATTESATRLLKLIMICASRLLR